MSDEMDTAGIAREIARRLDRLDPGDAAAARRTSPGQGSPFFWRCHSEFPQIARQPEAWAQIVQILAILTPRGDPLERMTITRDFVPLGRALCDGGNTAWGQDDARPVVSEERLARLLAQRGPLRGDALRRVLTGIARRLPPDVAIRAGDVAFALLAPDRTAHIASEYYKRLDRAERKQTKKEQGA